MLIVLIFIYFIFKGKILSVKLFFFVCLLCEWELLGEYDILYDVDSIFRVSSEEERKFI